MQSPLMLQKGAVLQKLMTTRDKSNCDSGAIGTASLTFKQPLYTLRTLFFWPLLCLFICSLSGVIGIGDVSKVAATPLPTLQIEDRLRQEENDPFADLANQIDDQVTEQKVDTESADPQILFYAGNYEEATRRALALDADNNRYDADEGLLIIAVEAQMRLGKYERALELHQQAIEKFPQSIRHRWLAVDVYRFNDDSMNARKMLVEIESLVRRAPWRYRDIENQLALVDFLLQSGIDAKEIMTKVISPIKQQNPRLAEVYMVAGKLALSKADYALAAENYQQAVKLNQSNPESHLGLARSFRPSDWAKASESLQQALTINQHHVPSLLMLVDQWISAENYSRAEELLSEILNVHPDHPTAWSYKAVLAHLDSDHASELSARQTALKHWPGNPEVDHIIGRELSEKYRFEEGSHYQRRSLVFDASYLPAKMQLAHDLLRLGQEVEGWKLAEEVFDADQYSVVAHNLLTLRDNISGFTTLEQNGLLVRMDQREADLYGRYVLQLLAEAEQTLVETYDVELQKPIFIEIFPRQQDFAIRTFGLPGGDGYLGVCFGRLITMNSPAAQGASLTNWRSVLWHEFCHVVTLQKTKNKMPRWLSEGISVYEERQKDTAWGQSINPTFQRFLLDENLTPVSQLSGAFLKPESAMHLQFAYFESSLVVQYLIQRFGRDALLAVLDDLGRGIEINQALSRHAAPIDFLDKDFAKYAVRLANSFAPDATFSLPETGTPQAGDIQQWQAFLQQHPNNIPAMMMSAQALADAGQYAAAAPILQQVIQLAPEVANDARMLLATCYREQDQTDNEFQQLQDLCQRDGDSVEALSRLLEIVTDRQDWKNCQFYADRLVGLNPLMALPHQRLATVAEQTNDSELAIRSLSALAQLNPVDPADIRYRLAVAFDRKNEWASAKREVLLALEQAPRYRDAQRLLLKLIEKQNLTPNDSNRSIEVPDWDEPPVPTDWKYDTSAADANTGKRPQ